MTSECCFPTSTLTKDKIIITASPFLSVSVFLEDFTNHEIDTYKKIWSSDTTS